MLEVLRILYVKILGTKNDYPRFRMNPDEAITPPGTSMNVDGAQAFPAHRHEIPNEFSSLSSARFHPEDAEPTRRNLSYTIKLVTGSTLESDEGQVPLTH